MMCIGGRSISILGSCRLAPYRLACGRAEFLNVVDVPGKSQTDSENGKLFVDEVKQTVVLCASVFLGGYTPYY